MGYFKFDFSNEQISDYVPGDSKYINESGIYEVMLLKVMANTTAKGSEYLDFLIDYEGQVQPIFQAITMTNTDGQPNLRQHLFNKLGAVCGATANTEIGDPVKEMVPIGKGGEEKECLVLKEFDNIPMYMSIQMEYSIYEGKMQSKKLVRNFFRHTDKATAEEIVNNGEAGKQFGVESEYAGKDKYKNDLTKEDVDEWKANLRNKNKDAKDSGSKDNKPSGGFGTRKFGKK